MLSVMLGVLLRVETSQSSVRKHAHAIDGGHRVLNPQRGALLDQRQSI